MTSKNISIREAADFFLARDHYTILCHANPDGDTAGCGYGLLRALLKLGKKARVRCADPISERFSFMWEGVEAADFSEETVVSVDVADRRLLGDLEREYADRVVFSVDHHVSHVDFSELLLNEPDASACAETIYRIIREMGVALDEGIAACLYTGIATDSGCFRYPSVTPETHRIAADLLEYDFGFAELNYILFERKTRERIVLEETIYRNMEFYFDGRCAFMVLEKNLLDSVDPEDVNGISAIPRQVGGVEVGVILKQKDDGWKASLRSNTVDVQKICTAFGGGGHIRAAGCSFHESDPAAVKSKLLAEIEKAL
ncbi:MAG: bifunctional oligoribonuclease/PAP phosphatase NrnA [Bacteroides sp.]|nr:bifunctional oligoribonuclease/PAP phosphatase NrnA [Eubacterium sp.]MCM1419479.1 bifunctional oligoribonuclease/PAP phosphatase NrnA [Roseburia sp.]MCM1463303.1 bifunctional oligoribonuclease/PAP phosphatase NrnA [Bacteroides sp.]